MDGAGDSSQRLFQRTVLLQHLQAYAHEEGAPAELIEMGACLFVFCNERKQGQSCVLRSDHRAEHVRSKQ